MLTALSIRDVVLIERLDALGVTVERRTELVGFDQQGDAVRATLRRVDGAKEACTASFLAGCDGAHGIVRRQLGFSFRGETPTIQPYLGGPMVSTYIRAADIPRIARTRFCPNTPFNACTRFWRSAGVSIKRL